MSKCGAGARGPDGTQGGGNRPRIDIDGAVDDRPGTVCPGIDSPDIICTGPEIDCFGIVGPGIGCPADDRAGIDWTAY